MREWHVDRESGGERLSESRATTYDKFVSNYVVGVSGSPTERAFSNC